MELVQFEPPKSGNGHSHALTVAVNNQRAPLPFITANTEEVSLYDLKHKHTIPVHVKDNNPFISHSDFIDAAWEVAAHVYGEGSLATPIARVSHAVKGRVYEARTKPAADLLDSERTLYYERMMFVIEVPVNYEVVGENMLTLTLGGIKAFNLDNLHSKQGAPESFKMFVGFKNSVCTNLCVSTDGLLSDIRVTSPLELRNQIYELLCRYNATQHLQTMKGLLNHSLSASEFARLIGRCKMYQYLSSKQKSAIPELLFRDAQINMVCRDYFRDKSFCRDEKGNINLWKLYNLFTGATKSSYIDSFLSRSVNATSFVGELASAIEQKSTNWFLK